MQKANGRVLWIDGLRGIACLAIFAHHFGCCFYPVTQYGPDGDWATPASIALAQSPLAVLLNGNFWVCVFCVIAGFVAARSHFTPPGEDGISLRRFSGQLLNRYFRMVLPVFWISLAVLIMVKLQLFTNRAFFETYYIYWSALTYAEDFYTFPSLILETFVKLCFVGTEKYVMVLWSIRLLFYGYFVSILLAQMSWGRNKRILWVYLFLAVGSLFCGLDLCMMGCFPIGVWETARCLSPAQLRRRASDPGRTGAGRLPHFLRAHQFLPVSGSARSGGCAWRLACARRRHADDRALPLSRAAARSHLPPAPVAGKNQLQPVSGACAGAPLCWDRLRGTALPLGGPEL